MSKRISIEDALDYCLLNQGALSSEQLLDKFPQHRAQLEPLLAIASNLNAIQTPHIPEERRYAIKERLVAAAVARQGTQPFAVADLVEDRRGKTRRRVAGLPPLVGSSMIALIVLIALVWWAAARSLPDSPFYDVKLASEHLVINFTGDAASRVRGHTQMANSRLDDTQMMVADGKVAETGKALVNYSEHISGSIGALNEIEGGERTELASLIYASTSTGSRILKVLKGVPDLPASAQFDIERVLQSVNSGNEEVGQELISAGIDLATLPTPIIALAIEPSPSVTTLAAQTGTPNPVAIEPGASASIPVQPTGTTNGAIGDKASPTPGIASNEGTQTAPPVLAVPPSQSKSSISASTSGVPLLSDSPTALNIPTAEGVTLTPTRAPSVTVTPATPGSSPTLALPSNTRTPKTPTLTLTRTSLPLTPTGTPASTHTSVLSSTVTSTYAPSATGISLTNTPAATALSVNVCDLDVSHVTTSCDVASSCVKWTAQVKNRGSGAVAGNWTAELLVNQGGGFHTVSSMHGSTEFSPDETTVDNGFCFDFAENDRNYKVRFSIEGDRQGCRLEKTSGADKRCEQAASTPALRPTRTREPEATKEPKPTHKPKPKH